MSATNLETLSREQLIIDLRCLQGVAESAIRQAKVMRRVVRAAQWCCRPVAQPTAEERAELRAALAEWKAVARP